MYVLNQALCELCPIGFVNLRVVLTFFGLDFEVCTSLVLIYVGDNSFNDGKMGVLIRSTCFE